MGIAADELFGVQIRKGEREMNGMKNYYRIIGVAQSATEEEIKSAYRKLAKKYHPDTHPGDRECEKRFLEVGEAYSVLGDAEKRKKYDAEYFSAGASKAAPRQSARMDRQDGRGVRLNPQSANPMDTTDMFERFMGIKR